MMETPFAVAVTCVNCRKNFSFNEPHSVSGSRMPLILPCGHAVCILCSDSFRNGLECRECGTVAKRCLDIYRTGFPPHMGLIGGLLVAKETNRTCQNQKKSGSQERPYRLVPAGAPLPQLNARTKIVANLSVKEECDDCEFDIAAVRCLKCSKNYCNKCLALRHGAKEKQSHHVVPLGGCPPLATTKLPAVQLVKPRIFCSTHTDQKLEFLCKDCDVAVCAYCTLLAEGGHQGHSVAFMGDLGPKFAPKINELLLEAQAVQGDLENAIKGLRGDSKAQWAAADKAIAELIAWQMAQVQMKGERMHNELVAAAKAATAESQELLSAAMQSLEKVKGLVACGKSYEPRESQWIMQNLEEACAVPCRLYVQDGDATACIIPDKAAFLAAIENTTLEFPNGAGTAMFPRGEDVTENWIRYESGAAKDPPAYRVSVPRNVPALTGKTPVPTAKTPVPTGKTPVPANKVPPPALELPDPNCLDPNGVRSDTMSVGSSHGSNGESETADIVRGFIAPGTSEVVTISHVVDPFDFYVVRVIDAEFRNRLTKKMQAEFRKLVEPKTVSHGDTVLAKYAGDGRWYRALVTATEAPEPRVLFVDYGNASAVGRGLIRTLPPKFASVPPLAVHCRLAKAFPRGGGEWSNAAIKWFLKIADGHRLLCRVYSVEAGVAQVDVGEIPGSKNTTVPLSVCDAAVFMQYAQQSIEPAVFDPEMELPLGYVRRPEVTYPSPRRWLVNERFVAQVSHVETADRFYVHRQDLVAGVKVVRTNEALTALCRPLFTPAGEGENLPVHLPKEGLACAALFTVDAVWYRALIMEVVPERRVKVLYVDYGNSDVISVDDIRHMPQRFASDPPLAIECCLHDITPPEDTESYSQEAANVVDALTRGQILELCVRKVLTAPTRYAVQALDRVGKDLARELVRRGLAQIDAAAAASDDSEGEEDDVSEEVELPPLPDERRRQLLAALSPVDGTIPAANGLTLGDDELRSQAVLDDVVHMPIRPDSVTDESLTDIVFVKCVSPDQIFISLKSAVYHFNDMKMSMQLYYADSKPKKRKWMPGERCAALRIADRTWNRGIVSEVDEDAAVALVELRDIVCRERVSLSLLRPLDESFTRVREAIFTVTLGGVVPAGGNAWTRRAGEFAARWTSIHTPTHIIKRGEITEGRLPVELLARETVMSGPLDPAVERFVSLNKELVANGLALPVRGAQDWPTWSSVEVTKEVEESAETADWAFPDQVAEESLEADLWPGVPTDQSLHSGSWLPIAVNDMDTFLAVPTNIDNYGYIYLHSIHAEATLTSVSEKLQRHFGDNPPPPGNFALRPGMPCVARYHLDNLWYRAEPVKELPNGQWEIIFVDYGSQDVLPAIEIWPTTFLIEIPVLCRKVALANIRPISEDGRWSRDGLDFLHVNVVEKRCTVNVRCPVGTPDPITVLLVREDGVQVSTLMAERGVGRYAEVKPGMVPGQPPLSAKRKRRSRSSRHSGGSGRSVDAAPERFGTPNDLGSSPGLKSEQGTERSPESGPERFGTPTYLQSSPGLESEQGFECGSEREHADGLESGLGRISEQGSERESEHGSEGGSKHGSKLVSEQGSVRGSELGSVRGSTSGSERGSVRRSERGSISESERGSELGSVRRSKRGSERGSYLGSECGSYLESERGSELGSIRGSEHGSEYGSKLGSESGSERGSERSSRHGSESGLRLVSKTGSKRSSQGGSERSSEHGSEFGSAHWSERSSERGSTFCSALSSPPMPALSLTPREDQPSPDIIECSDDEDVDLAQAPVNEKSLNESLDQISAPEEENLGTVESDLSLYSTSENDGEIKDVTKAVFDGNESLVSSEKYVDQEDLHDEDAVLLVDGSRKELDSDDEEVPRPEKAHHRRQWADEQQSEDEVEEPTAALSYIHYSFPDDDEVEVVVQSVESLNEIMVVPQDRQSLFRLEKLRELQCRIQTEAPMQPLLLERFSPSSCAAQFSDGTWRRTILVSTQAAQLRVWDVDGSRWALLNLERVCECRRDWMSLPTLLVKAKMPGMRLAPGATAATARSALINALEGHTFTARVLSRDPELTLQLYVTGKTTLALQPLIESGVLEIENED